MQEPQEYLPLATKQIRKLLKRKHTGVLPDLFERLSAELDRRNMRMGMVYHVSFLPKSKEFDEPYFVVNLVDKSCDPFMVTRLWLSGQAEVLKTSQEEHDVLCSRELNRL